MLTKPDYGEARALLLARTQPLDTERVPLDSCAARVLAEDLLAAEDVPSFDRSPYDGYAFRAADTAEASREHPVTLRITEEIAAGKVPTRPVTAGTAAKILTGAPIPEGADAVCMFEKTSFTAESVTLYSPARPGENIVRRGEDVQSGTVLARVGDRIDAGIAGTLAAQGLCFPLVFRRPKVGLISTGDEVREADAPPEAGKIRNTNRHMLAAALQREGFEPLYLGLAGDDIGHIAALIEAGAAACDAVILTGGVSVGDYDLTPAAMEQCGCEMLFRGVELKPGMACAYGLLKGKLVCGLSGNPASSLTNYYMLALPALKRLAGRRDAVPEEITLTLRDDFGKKSPATRVLRGWLDLTDGTAGLRIPADQGNVVLSSAIGCSALAIVPAGSGKLEAGTKLKGFVL
ncbi:MAG: molybdopterin molybdotransferase MoeA [Clostridia bacterium]|nr:molybdopterin molybdotransferase MoeA [Clostridia bacterium]